MEESATEDLRARFDLPVVLKALGPVNGPLGEAVTTLKAWRKSGAHRRDLDKDGTDDDDAAVTLMDAWWPKLARAIFAPSLGTKVTDQLHAFLPYDLELDPGDAPSAPSFEKGWYGFVSKDLRDLFTPKRVKGRWSRVYCGNGSKARCRAALRQSLTEALTVTKKDLYGRGDCAEDAQSACFDRNRSTVASAVSLPPFPFQNRPTFQQTVELTQKLPR